MTRKTARLDRDIDEILRASDRESQGYDTEPLSDREFAQGARLERRKYGLTHEEALQLVKHPRYLSIRREIEDWRGRHGFPAASSPFVRGHIQSLLGISTRGPASAPRPTLTVRQINAIVRAADGRNIYLTRHRLDEETVQRIVGARTRGREMEVRSLATGNWIPVLPERGDQLEIR
jgi:hypothetical protein